MQQVDICASNPSPHQHTDRSWERAEEKAKALTASDEVAIKPDRQTVQAVVAVQILADLFDQDLILRPR